MKFILMVAILLSCTKVNSVAQHNKCGTMHLREIRLAQDPLLRRQIELSERQTQQRIAQLSNARSQQDIIKIPVVVHVLWNKPEENISLEQIQSQIDVLNKDFRKKNDDTLTESHPFYPRAGDPQIEFCLANRDPEGNPTNGVTRTYTDSATFSGEGTEKRTATGGHDGWDATKYMNLWVCNLSGTTLGYATFPSDLATKTAEDGVVIRLQAFGTMGTAEVPNKLGRTGTHEVGHWLNLRHIWGDNQPDCGDDMVEDTPAADSNNYGCPTFPLDANSKCGTDANGEMYMNYMDYVDDGCMNMFTKGQIARMQAALNGERSGILTSPGCSGTTSIDELISDTSCELYPNPNNSTFTVYFKNQSPELATITIMNVLSEKVKSISSLTGNTAHISLPDAPNGVYFVHIQSGSSVLTKKVFISK